MNALTEYPSIKQEHDFPISEGELTKIKADVARGYERCKRKYGWTDYDFTDQLYAGFREGIAARNRKR